VGDLNREWQEPVMVAHNHPDWKVLDAGVQQWFDNQHQASQK
jgi:hypothetical protein